MSKEFGSKLYPLLQRGDIYEVIDSNSTIFLVNFISESVKFSPFSTNTKNLAALLINSVTFPDLSFGDLGTRRGGYLYNTAGSIDLGTLDITSYNDLNSEALSFWTKWRNRIIDGAGGRNSRLFPDEYKMGIEIYKLSRVKNEPMLKYTINGCFPSAITLNKLDWDDSETIPNISITLKLNNIDIKVIPQQLVRYTVPEFKNTFEILNNSVNVSIFNEKKRIDDHFSVNTKKFDKIKVSLKEKLINSGEVLLRVAAKKFEEEVRQALPGYLRDLDFLNFQNLVEQVYSRIEGYTKSRLEEYIRDIKLNNTSDSRAAAKALWYDPLTDISDYEELDLTSMIKWNPTSIPRN